MQRITVADKEYMKTRVNEEYQPLLRRLKDLLIPIKEQIREQVRKSMGIMRVEAEIEKLKAKLADLERQHKAVVGEAFAGREAANTPFSREVERRLMKHPEAKVLREVKADFKQTKDEIAMAGAPIELRNVLSALTGKLSPLQEKVKMLEAVKA